MRLHKQYVRDFIFVGHAGRQFFSANDVETIRPNDLARIIKKRYGLRFDIVHLIGCDTNDYYNVCFRNILLGPDEGDWFGINGLLYMNSFIVYLPTYGYPDSWWSWNDPAWNEVQNLFFVQNRPWYVPFRKQ